MKQFGFLLGACLSLTTLNASIIPSLVNVTPNGGAFNWNYSAQLSADQRLDPAATASAVCAGGSTCSPAGLNPASGTFFTIYDIAGYNGFTAAPSSWTAFSFSIGVTPSAAFPLGGDSSSLMNVSFFYNGPRNPAVGTTRPASGPTNLGTFTIGSIYNQQVTGSFTAQATKNTNDNLDGTLTQNNGSVAVPASGVPEPASMVLIGGGLVGLAFLRRRLVRN